MEQRATPVTVAVSRHVRPGREVEFEEWARRITDAAEKYPGHLGAGHIRSAETGGEHTLVYRFDTQEHFDAWQNSVDRARLVEESRPLIDGEPRLETATGLEYWFHDSGSSYASPPVWKQALLTWLGLYPVVLVVANTVGRLIASWPLPARSVLTSGLSVALMTWAVMPLVTKAFRPWLRTGGP
jgi:antibiotic biosynthesis monooxygenase (ABM) superfamily enzyme